MALEVGCALGVYETATGMVGGMEKPIPRRIEASSGTRSLVTELVEREALAGHGTFC